MRRAATIVLAAVTLAGTAVDAHAAQSRNLSEDRPSLISDVSITGNDSDLVRAAKKSVAARLRDATRSSGVLIDDAYMRQHQTGRITTSSGGAAVPTFAAQTAGDAKPATPPDQSIMKRAALEAENQKLRQEQARAGAEMNEPYGGNNGMEEDRAAQRSTQIPKQIEKNNQQMNPHP